ncbi:MAG: hypothetical protein ACW99U_15195 [Candidatus Thorarchaeota archaeon]
MPQEVVRGLFREGLMLSEIRRRMYPEIRLAENDSEKKERVEEANRTIMKILGFKGWDDYMQAREQIMRVKLSKKSRPW